MNRNLKSPTPDRTLDGGFYPFWFWNDELDADEIRRQVGEMADQGVKGFHIHPRQGLRVPYLSQAYFEMVETAVDAARAHGLVANLYDEYPYPSGAAGGEAVLGNPGFLATRLIQESYDVDGGGVRQALPRGRVLFCRAYPLGARGEVDWTRERDLIEDVGMVLEADSYNEGGLTVYNRKRYFASRPTPTISACLPAGSWRMFVAVQAIVESHKYWGYFLDVLNPEAVRHFIELTHARYARHIGHHFGDTVRTAFVDETAPGWSRLIPERFRTRYGYDLLDVLPALREVTHPCHIEVSHDLAELRYDCFCESFEKPLRDWCAAHGLLYSGEKPGLRLSQLRFMDIPGCDPGHTRAGDPMDLLGATLRSNARATASAAYFYGKEGALCECYHSLGWGATLQDAKLIAEGLLLMGIRYLVPHGFFYSTHALRKHDAPPSFFFQMPYWPLFGKLAARIDVVLRQFEGTHIDARILVVEPTAGLPTRADSDAYVRLQQLLMEEHIDFMMVDTDILEGARIADGQVMLRDIAACMVIVSPMQAVEPALARWLAGYKAGGGCVINCPVDVDWDTLRRELLGSVRPSLDLEVEWGDAGCVQLVTRRGEKRRLWFLLNTAVDPVLLRIKGALPLRELPLGEAVPGMLRKTEHGWLRELGPFESVLLHSAEDEPTAASPSEVLRIPVARACRVTPMSANILRMDDWALCLVDDDGREGPAANVPAVPLANQLKMAALPLVPAIRERFGGAPVLDWPRLHARYRTLFDCGYKGPVTLQMEPGSIVGDWHVHVNGASVLPQDLTGVAGPVPGCVGLDVTSLLGAGKNEITVDVRTDRADGGLRNPLWLTGDFAVHLNPVRLADREPDGCFEDYVGNGLPHYAGRVEYEQTIDLPATLPTESIIECVFALPFRGALDMAINGNAFHCLPWSPYRVAVPPGELRSGANRLCLRVYTTLAGAFDGQHAG